jgi:nitroreductase
MDAVKARKSIRGFKPDPVPREVIADLLSAALSTPSPVNTQPWEITVVTGKALEALKEANMALLRSGDAPDPRADYGPHTGIYRRRQIDLAIQLFQLMGIQKEDRDKRAQWAALGSRFFDAPAAIIISVDESVGEWSALFSVGSIAQTIALAALHYGLGTCIQGQAIAYPETVRRITGIPESKRLIIGIVLGYPDFDFPANNVQPERLTLESAVTWCDS